jgi:hypothetical protein
MSSIPADIAIAEESAMRRGRLADMFRKAFQGALLTTLAGSVSLLSQRARLPLNNSSTAWFRLATLCRSGRKPYPTCAWQQNNPVRGMSVEMSPPIIPVAFPYWLQDELGLANDEMTSYAIGGSTTDEINEFDKPYSPCRSTRAFGGRGYGPNDLVSLQ